MAENVVRIGLRVNADGKASVEELKAEQATENLVVEHGLLDATNHDVEDEVEKLDSIEEDVDFDSDENEVDMNLLSPNMREVAQ